MNYLRTLSILSFVLVLLGNQFAVAQFQPAPETPSGWRKSTDSGKRATVFTKRGLKQGDLLTVKFYPRKPLETNQDLEQWLYVRLSTSRAPMKGQWVAPVVMTRQTKNLVQGVREFKVDGKRHFIKGLAVGVDNVHVRFAAILKSDTENVNKAKYDSEKLLYSLLKVERTAAIKEKRGSDIEVTPPKIKNLKGGGPIKPGRYVGNAVLTRKNEAGRAYDLIIHANGEFEFLKGAKKREATGKYVYSQLTGRLDIGNGFENSTYDPKDEYCVFGKEATGKTVIYSNNGIRVKKLVWVASSDRPSPSEIKRGEEAAKAEAKRYKHVTEPGKGVHPDEIEAVMYCWESSFYNGAAQLDEEGFLILKDGRVLDGLPTAPDVIDLAVSRSREPDRWGWWKKDEDNFTFAWPVRPREYRQPNGKQIIGVPFEKGTRLQGDFGAAATSVMMTINFSSVTWWGIKFDKNGRFIKYRRGSMGGGGVPGWETVSMKVWDDEGAIATTLSPGATAMSKRKNNRSGADRMGRYEFEGYRLTLTFDDGRVEHHATFTNESKDTVWFEGRNLGLKK